MFTLHRAHAPAIAPLHHVRRWAWRLVFAVLLAHGVADLAQHLTTPTPKPGLVLVKTG
jgi:hypothetical protein